MKFVIALVAFLGCMYTAQADLSLAQAMAELRAALNLVAVGNIWTIFKDGDAEACELSNRVNSQVGLNAINAIKADSEFQFLVLYLESNDVPFEAFLGDLLAVIGIENTEVVPTPRNCPTGSLGGVATLMADIRTLMDRDRLRAYLVDLKSRSSEFVEFFDIVSARQTSFHNIRCLPEVQTLIAILAEYPIDLNYILDLLATLFGWSSIPATC